MQRMSTFLRTFGIASFFGLAALALPAHAGGVHVSIGVGLPLPVVVAPQPVYVAPQPVVVAPQPVYVQPAPVVMAQPQVVYARPRVVHAGWLPPGIAKKYYGHPKKHWKHHHHDD